MSVMVELDHYALANPAIESAVMTAAHQAWSRLCWDGISNSSTQYWHLNQVEAVVHVRDLEQALFILSTLDQTRAAAWRETAHDLQGGLGLVSMASSVLDREDLSKPAGYEFSGLVQWGVTSLRDMLNDFNRSRSGIWRTARSISSQESGFTPWRELGALGRI